MSHKQIWAPWRLEYILGDKAAKPDPSLELLPGADPECFLCQYAARGDDRQRRVIHRSGGVVTVLNRYPYNNGHLLVAPQRHCAELEQLTDSEHSELSRTIARMVALLKRAMSPEGFNIGLNLGRVAGAGLPEHVHWHVVPRWNGDTNFMPTTAGTNVIPQSLDALWNVLTQELANV